MNYTVRMRFGLIALALLTVAAVVFSLLNFQQRSQFVSPDDGVSWTDTPVGVEAWQVLPGSPASVAGIKPGDILEDINRIPVHSATEVTRRIWRSGVWSELRYTLRRSNTTFDTSLITVPAPAPNRFENDVRLMGLLYLFIGLFIFVRRWSAPRAIHFYVFCLVSFIFYSFHYTGKLNSFDQIIYWGNVVGLLLQPALLLHFALLFPERRGRLWPKLLGVYGVPSALLMIHTFVAAQMLDFLPSLANAQFLDRLEFAYWGVYFVGAGLVFLSSYRSAPNAVLRQQLKWLTGGTLVGILPFFLLYIVPLFIGKLQPWMSASVLSLALVPLCFGYAIIRYRLMDVDIIFKRGLAYTFATAAVVVIYFAAIAVTGELSHNFSTGIVGNVIAIVVAAFLFQPLRDWVQAKLDHFFYRDRLDYRRTLIEFGRTLTNEVRLEPMLGSVLDRISQTFLVDRLAVFVEDSGRAGTGTFTLARSMGVRSNGSLDINFQDNSAKSLQQQCLFFESADDARHESESVKRAVHELELNYFLPCRFRDRTVAILGLGKTVDGDFLSSEDLELLATIAGYVAIAIENAGLYRALEQKAAQIEQLKDFSENILQSLNIGVVAVDLNDVIESWNPQLEYMLGFSRAEAIGFKLSEVLPATLVSEIQVRTHQEHVSEIYKLHVQSRMGRLLVINASIAPLVGKTGARLGRLILLDDITERVRLEEQMVQNEKLTSLGLLAAGVAHEVNTPLAVISNYTQMLAKQLQETDPRQKTIEKIVKQTFRASEIVNNLLNFSRTSASELVEVNLNSILNETLSLVQHPFKTARINVIRSFDRDLPPIFGASTRLQQVFLNLFMNARDAMPSGGMLEVRTCARNGSVEVEVTDTGVGISTEHLGRIFDPFFTTKSTGRGTGLGLSVSYGIIKEHTGKIDVRSTPGKGTSFKLEFPAARKAVHA